MIRFIYALLAAGALIASASAQNADSLADQLRQGGYVVVFRHGATYRDQADTDPLNLDNVAKQRQLNDAGRQAARDIGATFKAARIPIGDVYTSRFYRAVETGRLISGKEVVPTVDVAEGGQVVTPIENDRRTAAMKRMAATPPKPGTNTIVVSHKPNILDAFGKDWYDIREGEASIFKPDGNGGYAFVRRVQTAEWAKLAPRQ